MSYAWSTLPMLDRLFDDVMNDVSGTAFGKVNGRASSSFNPAIDVRSNEEAIVFAVDVPGLKQEDLEITFERGVLTLKGERKYNGDAKDRVWLGRGYGAFTRSFTLPETADAEHLTASLDDGVLTIRVPKQPKAQPRRIAIGGAGKALEEKK